MPLRDTGISGVSSPSSKETNLSNTMRSSFKKNEEGIMRLAQIIITEEKLMQLGNLNAERAELSGSDVIQTVITESILSESFQIAVRRSKVFFISFITDKF